MKVYFRLSRPEYGALVNIIVSVVRGLLTGDSFTDVVMRETLTALGMKMYLRLPELKDTKNRLTPSPAEALALWNVLQQAFDMLPPYEQALAARLLSDMDRARLDALRAERLRLGNADNLQLTA